MTVISPTAAPLTFPKTEMEQTFSSQPKTLEQEKARLQKATKEFESFFNYYMLKTMRETVPDSALGDDLPFKSGMGKDIFDQLFDMEISKEMSNGGTGSISDMLYRSMEKQLESKYRTETGSDQIEIKPLIRPEKQESEFKPIEKHLEIKEEEVPAFREIDISKSPKVRPISNHSIKEDRIMAEFGPLINKIANENGLDPALIYSVIKAESDGDPSAVSPVGAKGLMQLMDTTASDLGVKKVFDPEENIRAGSDYLNKMIKRFGTLKLGLAAYNAGPGNVEKYGGMPPFSETVQYVTRVTDTLNQISKSTLSDVKAKQN